MATSTTSTLANKYLQPDSRSAEPYTRAQAVMPGGNTRTTVFSAPYPAYVASADGATVTDVEGQTRLDFVNNYTALIHGHAHPRILEAVSRQLARGTAVSFPTETEVRLAELLVDRVDSLERIRFTNSGTEAVMMAVQAARAFSGKSKIARFEGCYHGAYDHAEDVVLPFNDPDTAERVLAQHANELAAILVDPLPHRPGFLDPVADFLPRLRRVTRDLGILLISDEIISFRLDYHGAQHRYEYAADLTTLGKIIGGGFPVGAFGGRAEVMNVFDPTRADSHTHGGTFNGNPVTMVAGYEAMAMLTPSAFDRLAALGERVRTGLSNIIEARGVSWQIAGQASLFKLHPHPRPLVDFRSTLPTPAEQAAMEQFSLAMLGQGFILTPELAGAVSTPMAEQQIDDLIDAADRVFATL
ncbi:MAG: aspartate aminotransferase family protein [Chloroflexi bacterium]|nr:aspartate aminotransferase family protein [Chloroflexota bacterium]